MGFNSPAELTASYAAAGKNKTLMPILKIFLLGILAGALIAFGGVTANTASMGANRLIAGCVFPFGLVMVVLLGAELFTGNCLISISVLDKQAKFSGISATGSSPTSATLSAASWWPRCALTADSSTSRAANSPS